MWLSSIGGCFDICDLCGKNLLAAFWEYPPASAGIFFLGRGKGGGAGSRLRLAPATLQLLKVARHIVAAPWNEQARR